MGIRFRKSFKVAPGVNLNVSKKSVGVSVGNKYGHYSVNSSGRKTKTTSIPGTGISFVETSSVGGSSKKSKKYGSGLNSSFVSDSPSAGEGGNDKNNSGGNNNHTNFFRVLAWICFAFFAISAFSYLTSGAIISSFFFVIAAIICCPKLWDKIISKKKIKSMYRIISVIILFFLGASFYTPPENNVLDSSVTTARVMESSTSTTDSTTDEPASEVTTVEITTTEAPTTEAPTTSVPVVADVPTTQAAIQSDSGSVWIASTGNGKKYHSDPDCSNMTNPISISVDDAQAQGYAPCKKCH